MSLLFNDPKPKNPNGEKFVRVIEKIYKTELTDELGKLLEERGDEIKDIKFATNNGHYSALVIFDHHKVKEQLEKEKVGISE